MFIITVENSITNIATQEIARNRTEAEKLVNEFNRSSHLTATMEMF
jgi:hypothetical protein